jgi:adenosylcobinamide-GDP ribazoletransferase
VTREHPIRDAGLAISLLTVIPTPAAWSDDGHTQAAGWFPLVGGIVGAVGYAVVKLAEALGILHRAPFVVAALVIIAWALLTRLLHWDGLADVADGYWGSHDVARRLEIMSDSRTGAFGATAVALVAVLEVAALGTLVLVHETPVLVVPILARFAATAAAWFGKPARPGGLGRSVIGKPSGNALLASGGVLALAFVGLWTGLGPAGIAFGAFGLVLALGVPHLLALRFGGVTGDVMGASVLITEAILFTALALVV